jgi:hypothetical protein
MNGTAAESFRAVFLLYAPVMVAGVQPGATPNFQE